MLTNPGRNLSLFLLVTKQRTEQQLRRSELQKIAFEKNLDKSWNLILYQLKKDPAYLHVICEKT